MLLAFLWSFAGPGVLSARAQGNAVLGEFPVPDGFYFSEAAGTDPASGFTITNAGGIGFWAAFQQLGGVNGIGYPASRRFLWNGFVAQATQKSILQWNPAKGQSDVVNTFDALSQRGLDPWLRATKQIPPAFDNAADAGKPWPQVVARHQAELDWNPAIKARYFADPDPLAHFGLPQSYADEGNVLVVRCQRAVFQQWKQAVPWANAGDVTIANAGDIVKEAGLLPAQATTPERAQDIVVAPLGPTLALSPDQVTAVHTAAGAALPALVRIVSDLGDGDAVLGSGAVIDPAGVILTNAHVVDGGEQFAVTLSDGRTVPAGLMAEDSLADIALLRIQAPGLHAIARGSAATVQPGSLLVAVGYSDYFPAPPTIRVGQARGTLQDALRLSYIKSNVFILPGDSGGPLVNLQGQMIGIDTAIHLGRNATSDFTGYSISVDSALPLVDQMLAASGSPGRPNLGIVVVPMSADIAAQLGLPNVTGLLIASVAPGSPAARVGLEPGDIVTAMDGVKVDSYGTIDTILSRHRAGDAVRLSVVDPAGASRDVAVTLPAT